MMKTVGYFDNLILFSLCWGDLYSVLFCSVLFSFVIVTEPVYNKLFSSGYENNRRLLIFFCNLFHICASIMAESQSLTGYGPSHNKGRYYRLIFDGDERHYEQWQVKFLGFMKLRKLKATILAPGTAEVDADKNEEAYAELIQCLDEKSLSLVMNAADDGRKALGILRDHYAGVGKPRVISLYTELTSLIKSSCETVTEYVIRAETAAASPKICGENITDSLLIAMVLKGLPDSFKPFVALVTQSKGKQTFSEFKATLRSFEDTENARTVSDDSVMRLRASNAIPGSLSRLPNDLKCYNCGGNHFARECSKSKKKLWCNHCQSSSHSDQACRKQREIRGK